MHFLVNTTASKLASTHCLLIAMLCDLDCEQEGKENELINECYYIQSKRKYSSFLTVWLIQDTHPSIP